jgi:uncharacterized protein YceH (UPF0502 family)
MGCNNSHVYGASVMEAASTPPPGLPTFSLVERRVLGVLVEKAKTTPDAYPLSLNALTTGCNQKSNRDPVLNLSEDDVEACLNQLQKAVLVTRIQGGRVERWKHNLYEQWNVNKVELAILAELLLRGAQTEGELRTRASRMEPIADLDALRQALKPMAERKLIVFLGEEGRRGTQITHGFHDPRELEAIKARGPVVASETESIATPSGPSVLERISALETKVEELTQQLSKLREVT